MRTQFHHIIDIVPTILEATGIKAPDTVDGIKQKPIQGVSMMYSFDKANANAASKRTTQYFEMAGNRGIYKDGWYANTTPPIPPWALAAAPIALKDYNWELYKLTDDYSQYNDLAAKMPAKLKEMQLAFGHEAAKYGVLPLDNQAFSRAIAPRPSAVAGRTLFTYTGVNVGIPTGNAPNILNRSFTITADVEVPDGGGDGMIVTEGGRFAGYGLYILKGRPVFVYNALALLVGRWAKDDAAPLAAGKHHIVFDFTYDGPGIAKSGTGVLSVDGTDIAKVSLPKTIPFLLPPDETFDIGDDTRTGVNDLDYQVPFPFKGSIDTLTIKLGPTQLTEEEQRRIQEANARARD